MGLDSVCASLADRVQVNSDLKCVNLWNNLIFSLWSVDKLPQQDKEAARISELQLELSDAEDWIRWTRAFFSTISKEWMGIDKYRMNKFLRLLRFQLRNAFIALHRFGWKEKLVMQYMTILSDLCPKRPEGAAKEGRHHHISDKSAKTETCKAPGVVMQVADVFMEEWEQYYSTSMSVASPISPEGGARAKKRHVAAFEKKHASRRRGFTILVQGVIQIASEATHSGTLDVIHKKILRQLSEKHCDVLAVSDFAFTTAAKRGICGAEQRKLLFETVKFLQTNTVVRSTEEEKSKTAVNSATTTKKRSRRASNNSITDSIQGNLVDELIASGRRHKRRAIVDSTAKAGKLIESENNLNSASTIPVPPLLKQKNKKKKASLKATPSSAVIPPLDWVALRYPMCWAVSPKNWEMVTRNTRSNATTAVSSKNIKGRLSQAGVVWQEDISQKKQQKTRRVVFKATHVRQFHKDGKPGEETRYDPCSEPKRPILKKI